MQAIGSEICLAFYLWGAGFMGFLVYIRLSVMRCWFVSFFLLKWLQQFASRNESCPRRS